MPLTSWTGLTTAVLMIFALLQVSTAANLKSQSEIFQADLTHRVIFDSHSADLDKADLAEAAAFAERLADIPGLRLTITGFAVETGSRLSDRHLALARARALRQALVEAGFPKERTLLLVELLAPVDDETAGGDSGSDATGDRSLSPYRAEARPYAP